MKKLIFITGGERSGKSRQALTLADSLGKKKAFIATAQAFDAEMADRINKHKEERDDSYLTIEEPINLVKAFQSVPADVEVVILDCLTVWLGNLMHADPSGKEPKEISSFLEKLSDQPFNLIVISNEVGMGIIPENKLARRFRDFAGRLNQRVAAQAHRVIFMVSGIPQTIKEDK